MIRRAGILALALLAAGCADPQSRTSDRDSAPDTTPRRYSARFAVSPVIIDGRLDDSAWRSAAWSSTFVDIEGPRRPRPRYATRMKITWDDQNLYIAAELEEPHIWATLTRRDDIVFRDNDFEIFIDPDGDARNYYEIELNAMATIFDLLLVNTYRNGGPARHEWNLPGLLVAVHIQGTLNDPRDIDRAWSVELALPWRSLAEHSRQPCPPHPGDTWRMNFSRVEWDIDVKDGAYEKERNIREHNWVWSPQGVIDMHVPDTWGFVGFTR